MWELRKRRLEFLGIYHSHPHWLDTNEPSPKDIALADYSKAIYFIVTPRPYATTPIRAFSIRDGRAMELEIQVLPGPKRAVRLPGLKFRIADDSLRAKLLEYELRLITG